VTYGKLPRWLVFVKPPKNGDPCPRVPLPRSLIINHFNFRELQKNLYRRFKKRRKKIKKDRNGKALKIRTTKGNLDYRIGCKDKRS
jgi:hypothetical protein